MSRHIPSALQGSFSFPTSTFSLTVEHPFERIALRALLGLTVLFLFAYLYFVSASILNVIARKEAVTHMAATQNAISALEQNYFVLSRAVTPQKGTSIGLAPIGQTTYVYRPGNTAAATIERNEI